MSTDALIAYKRENGNYNVNSIHYDGYINGGVGQSLVENWSSFEDVKALCNGNEICCLGENLEKTEVYDTWSMNRRKNLTFDELCNLGGNFNYSYVFEDGVWKWLNNYEGKLADYIK